VRPNELVYFFKGLGGAAIIGGIVGMAVAVIVLIILRIKWWIQDKRNRKPR